MNRQEAWTLVCEYTQSPQLRRHMLSVEVAMRTYARHFGEDEEKPDSILLADIFLQIARLAAIHPVFQPSASP
ncbi:MAG: hypothetical protein HC875_32630 [Anaerolineales bacterium]|nr:hypothetical protein [Anaerolineales bacterium]